MVGYRESVIFHVAGDDPATIWSGHGDLLLPADTVFDAPTLAIGGPELLDVPDIEMVLNGSAQRFDVSLSGISDTSMRLAIEQTLSLSGTPAFIGRVVFDAAWQLSAVVWEWEGEVRKLAVRSSPDDEGRARTLSITLAHGDTTRSRAPLAFFTDAEQRRDYPTDAAFSNVAGINAGTSRRWGPS